ncbi:hypothetical protein A134_23270 [Vibrio crassostreae 9CS106]|uniref:Uncharacterized protein n=1 Tax=Vibrio crassostreae 9CS106 TaxID=1191300 RepID=A0A1B1C3G4_9VIBR|nr:hypothetical protein A134_23270 [Vibrio crassostreae 9CS106]
MTNGTVGVEVTYGEFESLTRAVGVIRSIGDSNLEDDLLVVGCFIERLRKAKEQDIFLACFNMVNSLNGEQLSSLSTVQKKEVSEKIIKTLSIESLTQLFKAFDGNDVYQVIAAYVDVRK